MSGTSNRMTTITLHLPTPESVRRGVTAAIRRRSLRRVATRRLRQWCTPGSTFQTGAR